MKKILLLGIGLLALAFILLGAQNREPVATPPSVPQLANVTTSMTDGATTPPLPNDTYPVAKVIDGDTISIIKDGKAVVPERPGLGVTVNLATVRKYVHSVKIELAAKTIFRQPEP